MRGYRTLAQGNQIINLRDVIAGGGLDLKGYPTLAVARADWQRVRVEQFSDGSLRFTTARNWGRVTKANSLTFPQETFPRRTYTVIPTDGHTVVPIIPPQYRPKFSLANYHILFEADWKAVPKDPALLKDLGDGLYAVLAVWDLTEIERTVLGITRTTR
jgi:hypothetical protein